MTFQPHFQAHGLGPCSKGQVKFRLCGVVYGSSEVAGIPEPDREHLEMKGSRIEAGSQKYPYVFWLAAIWTFLFWALRGDLIQKDARHHKKDLG